MKHIKKSPSHPQGSAQHNSQSLYAQGCVHSAAHLTSRDPIRNRCNVISELGKAGDKVAGGNEFEVLSFSAEFSAI